MDAKNLSRLERKLFEEREHLLVAVHRLSDETREAESDDPKDVGDVCLSTLSKESLFLQRSQAQARLRRIEAALARVDDGSFGTCVTCGGEINARRLEALPWASNCIRCQEELEQERQEQSAASSSAFRIAV
jgi:DnaK suppressor protein